MSRLKVTALMDECPGPLELWTLRAVALAGFEPDVLTAPPPARKRADLPIMAAAALGAGIARYERRRLDEMLDQRDLEAWWRSGELAQARAGQSPDILLAFSGSQPPLKARQAALFIRYGLGPDFGAGRGIAWAIIEGRADWIGAAVLALDAFSEPGSFLWQGSPQLAPGDTGVELLFRVHLEATEAVVRLLGDYARGLRPKPLIPPLGHGPRRGEPGLRDWMRYLRLRRGRHASVLFRRAIEC